MKIKLFYLSILFPLLLSCVNSSNTLTPIIPLPTIINPSPFVALPTQTLQPTNEAIQSSCMNLEKQIPSDLILSGVWVRGLFTPYLEDIKTGLKIGIPLKGNSPFSTNPDDFALSKDKKWIAYIDIFIEDNGTNKRILRGISSSGYSLDLSTWPIDFQIIHGWSNTDELILEANYFSNQHRRFIFLNPFKGNYHVVYPSWLKEIDSHYPSFLISPNQSNIFIITTGYPNGKFEIRDIETGKIIDSRISGSDYYEKSVWYSDGNTLAVSQDNNINIIGIDGIEKSLFTPYRVEKLQWSTFEKKLLIFGDSFIKIFNAETGNLDNYCIQGNGYEYNWNNVIWSPDEQFIIVNAYRKEIPSKFPSELEHLDLLIEVKQFRTFELPAEFDTHRTSWLVSP